MESENVFSGLDGIETTSMKQLLFEEGIDEEYFDTPLSDDEIISLKKDDQSQLIIRNRARLQKRIEYFRKKPSQIEAVKLWMSCRENDVSVPSLVMKWFLAFLESKIEENGGKGRGDIYREDLKLIFMVNEYKKQPDIKSVEDACIKILGIERSDEAGALVRNYHRKKKEFKKLGLL